MITKFLRKRVAGKFARIQVHPNGSHTFKFKKTNASPSSQTILNTEAGFRITTETPQYLIIN